MSTLTGEAADRQAIRDLVDAWARCADRRRPADQAALFTARSPSTRATRVPPTPAQRLQGYGEMAEAFKVLDAYGVTTHFNGQSTVQLDGDRASGETYCLAHHVWEEDAQRTLSVLSIRYLDTFVRQEGGWCFAERRLINDWSDRRPSAE